MAAATRDDLAAAHAEILATDGHENRAYDLGAQAVSFRELAAILRVPYVAISAHEYAEQQKHELGLPDPVVAFLGTWMQGMIAGEWRM